MSERFIGLMSGTSMDGIDAVLVQIDEGRVQLEASHSHPWPAALQAELHALAAPGDNEIERMGQADRAVGEQFGQAVLALLAKAGVSASAVRAIGSHGQTIRHRPMGRWPFTLQIGCPATIAGLTGIDTIADFRRADIAAGGQGAPLVPALHQALFALPGRPRAVVNIGGIANITWLPGNADDVIGFDTGPGNTLLDLWCRQQLGQPYDGGGQWSAQGKVDEQLLNQLRSEPYFDAPAPKSTGRELFHGDWLQRLGGERLPQLASIDVAATLCALTATTIADALRPLAASAELLVCGGGAHNQTLLAQLAAALPSWQITTTSAHGVDGDAVEGMAFAWLAHRYLAGLPGNLPAVTGAHQPLVLGALHPAPR